MKRKVILLSILLLFGMGLMFAQSTSSHNLLSFMVYGDNFMIGVALPDTWTVDMNAAKQYGVNGFFYLKDNRKVSIVLNLVFPQDKSNTLGDWEKYDIDGFIDYYKGYTANKLKWNIENKNKYKIDVYTFTDSTNRITQYSAYIDTGCGYYANIYITASRGEQFTDSLVDDFKMCLEKSTFTGIGFKVQNQ
jgi:hypothetical protein